MPNTEEVEGELRIGDQCCGGGGDLNGGGWWIWIVRGVSKNSKYIRAIEILNS